MDVWQNAAMVVVGWILGLLTLSFAKDIESREKCLNNLYALKSLLDNLSKYTRFPSRTENGYYERLMEIKPLIERLDVEKTGLAFPCYVLNGLLAESLKIFKKLDPEHENLAFHPTQTVVMLILAWDDDVRHPNFGKIDKIQKFLSKSLFGRCVEWFFSIFQRPFNYSKNLLKTVRGRLSSIQKA